MKPASSVKHRKGDNQRTKKKKNPKGEKQKKKKAREERQTIQQN
jgi:hypothetical protein